MVVSCLYGYIDKQTDGIDRHGDRHRDREIWRWIWREAIHPDAYLSGLSGWLVVGSVHFGSFRFGSDFLTSIKKFFNFPNFFSNYLIFNAFQI